MEKITIQHSQERYENIFNMYEVENENSDKYIFYNINNKVSFFLQDCLDNNIDILWLKNNTSIIENTRNKEYYEY